MKKLFLLSLAMATLTFEAVAQKTISELGTEIDSYITTNGQKKITGAQLNGILQDIKASFVNLKDENSYTSLSTYNTARSYDAGMCCERGGVIYKCNATTTGAFDATKWDMVGGKVVKSLTTTDGAAHVIYSFVVPATCSYIIYYKLVARKVLGSAESCYKAGYFSLREASGSISPNDLNLVDSRDGLDGEFTGTTSGTTMNFNVTGVTSTNVHWQVEFDVLTVSEGTGIPPPPPPTGD